MNGTNGTYKLDEKGIPYRVGAFIIQKADTAIPRTAETDHGRTIGLLRHRGQLQSFQLYFF